MMLPTITVRGRLTRDPELRFTADGVAVAKFAVACNDRRKTPGGDWEDGPTLFLDCVVWRGTAEQVAEALRKGMEVVVSGSLEPWSYERDGETRRGVQVNVRSVGVGLVSLPGASSQPRTDAGAAPQVDAPPF